MSLIERLFGKKNTEIAKVVARIEVDGQIDKLFDQNPPDKMRQVVKKWAHGRLGINEPGE